MANEEWRVEVELDDEAHGLSLGERLRAFGLDGEARKSLGDQVVVTRDGSRMLLYATTESDAREAAKTAQSLVSSDGLSADITVTRWNSDDQTWADPASGAVSDDSAVPGSDTEVPDRNYVVVEHYKPEFLRDLGL